MHPPSSVIELRSSLKVEQNLVQNYKNLLSDFNVHKEQARLKKTKSEHVK